MVLVAHGSADPRAALQTRALARAVGGVAAFLDHAGPRPASVLRDLSLAGHRSAVVVPLLLTSAYHGRVDLPAALAGLELDVALADVLGPVDGVVPPELLDALALRLGSALRSSGSYDGLVLAAAGTRDADARETVSLSARALGERLGVPCTAAFATSDGMRPAEAVARLRAAGARRVAMSAYFLAPGKLYDLAAAGARGAGAVAVTRPLGASPDLARLVRRRAASARVLVPA
ncbi:sirohydrochlorin chelatase [Virgisporangium aurantiacum]|uniref:sirohydrochlorin chelatase n=1 Tax=Virgisporangium aurantiacum TaxID=175570 RepID=UPI00194F88E0